MIYRYLSTKTEKEKEKEKKTSAGFVFKELRRMIRVLANNKDILYQGQLLKDRKYGKNQLQEWLNQFKEDKNIKDLSDKIKTILETRAVEYGLNLGQGNGAKTNAAFFIFFMKNAFGWKDTSVSEHNINLPIPILGTPEQLRDKIKQSPKRYIKAGQVFQEKNSDIIEDTNTSDNRGGDKAEAISE